MALRRPLVLTSGAHGELPNTDQLPISTLQLPKGLIDGLQMRWVGAGAVTVSSGACYIESSGKVVANTADMPLTGLSLAASSWSHLYAYESGGVLAIEVSSTAPASPYNGTARSKTGDTSRRYVGSILTSSSASLFKFVHSDNQVFWNEDSSTSPFRILSDGQAASKTTVSCLGPCPITATAVHGRFFTSSTSTAIAYAATAGSNGYQIGMLPGSDQSVVLALNASQQLEYKNPTSAGSGRGTYIDIRGYLYER